jgi:hypothetical protein
MVKVLTTYLSRKGDPQLKRRYYPNRKDRMAMWYPGIERLGNIGVIFHDELDDNFMSWYPCVEFVKVGDYLYSSNDGRFIMFRDYLLEHPEVTDVWMTDLFDVRVNSLPELGDKLMVMTEPVINPRSGETGLWSRDRRWVRAILRRIGQDGTDILDKPMFNPGVWGGKRELVLPVLEEMVKKFDEYKVEETNANMFVFSQVLYNIVGMENIITGCPLHSEFKKYEDRTDCSFNHK